MQFSCVVLTVWPEKAFCGGLDVGTLARMARPGAVHCLESGPRFKAPQSRARKVLDAGLFRHFLEASMLKILLWIAGILLVIGLLVVFGILDLIF